RSPEPSGPCRSFQERRTPSVEAGYRAPIQTCKYLFEKKVHLIVFFTNNVDFQSIRDIAPSNHNNQNHTADGPLVEKTR
ncbi:hypothetical protein, partial [Thalassospira sp. CH_XMU1448-2]|uniref:hypothetical protein n=1 Tax=Thalassospira sp. CH_XMU1448-2 TaxID=3107773 RepID=UPI0030098209